MMIMKPILVAVSMDLLLACTVLAQAPTDAQDAAALEQARAAALAAQGQYNYSASASNLQDRQADSIGLQNSSQALREWYARKQANNEFRAAKYPVSSAGLMTRLAELKRPDRLQLDQYSRETGKLNWPAVLKDPVFAEERAALDELFAQRQAFDAGTNSQFYRR